MFMVEHMRDDSRFDVDHEADMIKNFVEGWDLDKVRVAVTLYEDHVTEYIKLGEFGNDVFGYTDKLGIMKDNLGRGQTNNLNYVMDFTRTNTLQSARAGVAKVAVAIVRYLSPTARTRYLQAAQDMKNSGVTLYVLAVAPSDGDRSILLSGADHYFEYSDWWALEDAVPNRTFNPNCP